MARIEKTVFISYRRTDVYTALAVYENLKNQGYDVFFDYRSISSGDFEQIITANIRARAHFLLILTPTALDRCNEPGDWLRREIEMAIDEKRNIIPLFFKSFHFGNPSISEKLTGKLKNLSRYNGLNVHEDYFDEAMRRLSAQYLNIPLDTVLHPVSTLVQKVVQAEQNAADKALEQIVDVKDLVKQSKEKNNNSKITPDLKHIENIPDPIDVPQEYQKKRETIEKKLKWKRELQPSQLAGTIQPTIGTTKSSASKKAIPWQLIVGIVGAILVFFFANHYISGLYADIRALKQLGTAEAAVSTSEASLSTAVVLSDAKTAQSTVQALSTETSIHPTSELGIGSTMTGKDGMTLLYVPAGEFTMGTKADDALAECQKYRSDCRLDLFKDEEPPHDVFLDAFWIDQTEVTVRMYYLCVEAGVCKEPISKTSSTHSNYYGNAEFNHYPVIYVDWDMAGTYCGWVDRRLPTEAEWEKAARGPDGNIYPWGNTFDGTLVNFCDTNCPFSANKSFNDGYVEISPVGNYPSGKSVYGALDMAGNVWEWVNDWYSDTYYAGSPKSNPLGPDSGQYRVLRGGSWYDLVNSSRSTNRLRNYPPGTVDLIGVGFRCATSTIP